MSDHLDSPEVRADPRLDISDTYVFKGRTGTVFIMCTNPLSGGGGFWTDHHAETPPGHYNFKISLDRNRYRRFDVPGHLWAAGPRPPDDDADHADRRGRRQRGRVRADRRRRRDRNRGAEHPRHPGLRRPLRRPLLYRAERGRRRRDGGDHRHQAGPVRLRPEPPRQRVREHQRAGDRHRGPARSHRHRRDRVLERDTDPHRCWRMAPDRPRRTPPGVQPVRVQLRQRLQRRRVSPRPPARCSVRR